MTQLHDKVAKIIDWMDAPKEDSKSLARVVIVVIPLITLIMTYVLTTVLLAHAAPLSLLVTLVLPLGVGGYKFIRWAAS